MSETLQTDMKYAPNEPIAEEQLVQQEEKIPLDIKLKQTPEIATEYQWNLQWFTGTKTIRSGHPIEIFDIKGEGKLDTMLLRFNNANVNIFIIIDDQLLEIKGSEIVSLIKNPPTRICPLFVDYDTSIPTYSFGITSKNPFNFKKRIFAKIEVSTTTSVNLVGGFIAYQLPKVSNQKKL